MDINVIWDDDNLVEPWREPQVDLPPLDDDIVVIVEQIHVYDIVVRPIATNAQAPLSTALS